MVAIEHERENGAERDPLHTIKKSFGPGNFRILMSGVLVSESHCSPLTSTKVP